MTDSGTYQAECPICEKIGKVFFGIGGTKQGAFNSVVDHMASQHGGRNN